MQTATAITYRTTECSSKLRSVLCTDVRETTVLIGRDRLVITTGTMLRGTSSAHKFWAEVLGLGEDDSSFACPSSAVAHTRTIGPVKVSTRRQ